ncbi:MAG: hypothetical protein JWO32_579 [Bacteroidetes bacterium]|nr:hypothetical protein [Bacteroidota bacterium]
MYNLLLILFFISVLPILHSYLLYPLGLILFSKKSTPDKSFLSSNNLPSISILMAAYNEEKVLEAKIESVINTSYPLNKITFFIGSDSSTDRTNDIIRKWNEKYSFIQLVEFKGRTGKAGIINKLVMLCSDEILVLTDANVIFKRDTLYHLVKHFQDRNVAQVCANIIKVAESNRGISEAEKTYMAVENKIKYFESLNWKIVMGAEGGCNAIRRECYAEVPDTFCVDDFFITMNVIEQGKEIVFEEEAICYEDAPSLSSVEFARKVRISMGNFQNLSRYKKLLLPFWKGPSFAFWSHKVLRWITPFLLVLCLTFSIALSFYNKIFIVVCILQLSGMLTPLFKMNFRYFKVISHFYLMNLALLKGFFIFIKGVNTNIWQPTKRHV